MFKALVAQTGRQSVARHFLVLKRCVAGIADVEEFSQTFQKRSPPAPQQEPQKNHLPFAALLRNSKFTDVSHMGLPFNTI